MIIMTISSSFVDDKDKYNVKVHTSDVQTDITIGAVNKLCINEQPMVTFQKDDER